jgi:hypothetical protein
VQGFYQIVGAKKHKEQGGHGAGEQSEQDRNYAFELGVGIVFC